MARVSRRRVSALIAIVVTACACTSSYLVTQPTPLPLSSGAAAKYLEELLGLMQQFHANTANIDWPTVRSQVLAAGASAPTTLELHAAIGLALRLLADDDSYYQPSSGGLVGPPRNGGCGRRGPDASNVPASIGYVRVNECGCDGSDRDAYAVALQRVIRDIDGPPIVGWIIDLRGNIGGSVFAMMAGVGPILGDGIAGWLRYADREYDYTYENGSAISFGEAFTTVADPYRLGRPNPRVAVLTDGSVASSGEATAVLFKARPGTRSFGSATCGNHHLQEPFRLSDSGILFLASAQLADRTRRQYGGPISPDEVIADPAAVVPRAVEWILNGR